MSELHTRPEPCLLPIRRPACPKCQSRTLLAAIRPGPDGFELRTFECRKCNHSFTNAIAQEPMNVVSGRWTAGGLKPPA